MFENAKSNLNEAKGHISTFQLALTEFLSASANFPAPDGLRVGELPSGPLFHAIRDLKTSLDSAMRELIVVDGGAADTLTGLPTASDKDTFEYKAKHLSTPRIATKSFVLSLGIYNGGAGEDVYRLNYLYSAKAERNAIRLVLLPRTATSARPKMRPKSWWSKIWLSVDHSSRPHWEVDDVCFDDGLNFFSFQPVVPTLWYLTEVVTKQLSRFEKFVEKRRPEKIPKKARTDTEGALARKTPETREAGQDFIRDIVSADLESGRYTAIVTRFPPEPNGYLHIGHAKSICLNFGIAEEFGGHCNLRYDDTNPTKEAQEYIDAIERDVRWLGFDWGSHLYHASDYFERLYEWAEHLIRAGKAYVDDQSQEEMRATRGTLTEAGTESPFRERGVEENLDLFRRMRAGEFPNGARVLRAKIDMGSGNINLRDPVLYRILQAAHPRTGKSWCIYPSYDFAHGQSDAIEGITHSLCTLEFEDHRPLYDWLLDNLPVPSRPHQYEFARLNLTYTVLSKRVLTELVRGGHVAGWDDPRMPTLAGLRRRGVPPEAIRDFVKLVGVAKANSTVDLGLFEFSVREHLNKTAQRRMAVLRPLKVVIENYPKGQSEDVEALNHPEDPSAGTRLIRFDRELYIERDDFMENPTAGFLRLAPGRQVRLRYAYTIKCHEIERDAAGYILALRCSYDPLSKSGTGSHRKGQTTMHWVSASDSLPAEVRLYNPLFAKPDPDAGNFAVDVNPNSLEVITDARVEPSLAARNSDAAIQFERQGYFCLDPDSTPERPVFNRTVGLRDTWAKIAGT